MNRGSHLRASRVCRVDPSNAPNRVSSWWKRRPHSIDRNMSTLLANLLPPPLHGAVTFEIEAALFRAMNITVKADVRCRVVVSDQKRVFEHLGFHDIQRPVSRRVPLV